MQTTSQKILSPSSENTSMYDYIEDTCLSIKNISKISNESFIKVKDLPKRQISLFFDKVITFKSNDYFFPKKFFFKDHSDYMFDNTKVTIKKEFDSSGRSINLIEFKHIWIHSALETKKQESLYSILEQKIQRISGIEPIYRINIGPDTTTTENSYIIFEHILQGKLFQRLNGKDFVKIILTFDEILINFINTLVDLIAKNISFNYRFDIPNLTYHSDSCSFKFVNLFQPKNILQILKMERPLNTTKLNLLYKTFYRFLILLTYKIENFWNGNCTEFLPKDKILLFECEEKVKTLISIRNIMAEWANPEFQTKKLQSYYNSDRIHKSEDYRMMKFNLNDESRAFINVINSEINRKIQKRKNKGNKIRSNIKVTDFNERSKEKNKISSDKKNQNSSRNVLFPKTPSTNLTLNKPNFEYHIEMDENYREPNLKLMRLSPAKKNFFIQKNDSLSPPSINKIKNKRNQTLINSKNKAKNLLSLKNQSSKINKKMMEGKSFKSSKHLLPRSEFEENSESFKLVTKKKKKKTQSVPIKRERIYQTM